MIDNLVAAVLPVASGDSTSDPVTIVAIIGLAVILIVNLILDARGNAGSRPDDPVQHSDRDRSRR